MREVSLFLIRFTIIALLVLGSILMVGLIVEWALRSPLHYVITMVLFGACLIKMTKIEIL